MYADVNVLLEFPLHNVNNSIETIFENSSLSPDYCEFIRRVNMFCVYISSCIYVVMLNKCFGVI